MKISYIVTAVAVLVGMSAGLRAEELIGDIAEQTVAVSTVPAMVEPMAVSTVPALLQPVAIATAPANTTQVAVPVAVPVDMHESRDLVAWKKLDGKVQSIDRNNHAVVVQDNEGKDVRVVLNDRIRVFRRGQEIGYSDIAPNDSVVLRYETDRPAKTE